MSREPREHGFVTLWVLGLCVLMLFVGGLAVDLWRAFSERLALAHTVDAAAVAGSNAVDTDHFRETGEIRLDPGLAEQLARDNLDAQADRRALLVANAYATPTEVTVTATGRVDFTLLRIFMGGQEPLTVSVSATADPRRSP
ncbi:MAG: Tad domain-containing protein [Acidimicrobiales bacterium]